MARLLGAIHDAAAATGGLVDGTLVAEIEAAGYATDLGTPVAAGRRARDRPAPRHRPTSPPA